jgi:hypothetical protein
MADARARLESFGAPDVDVCQWREAAKAAEPDYVSRWGNGWSKQRG